MDSYQPIFDAVRSKICNGDVGSAIQSAIGNMGLEHHFMQACQNLQYTFQEYERPSAIFKPKLFIDGDKWCAMYGDNLQMSVAGFGKTPAEAMSNFDQQWNKELKPAT